MTELQKSIEVYQPPVAIAAQLHEEFGAMFAQMEQWQEKANTLIVTDESQTGLMYEARVARLAVKDVRIKVEKTRKGLKEDALKTSQAVDGVARTMREKLEAIEAHLAAQENFAVNKEAARIEALRSERYTLIVDYLRPEILSTPYPDWGTMHEDDFQATLNAVKDKARQIEAERVVRIEKERAEKEELERLRKEQAEKDAEIARLQKEQVEANKIQSDLLAFVEKQKSDLEELTTANHVENNIEPVKAPVHQTDREKLRAYGAALLQVPCAPIQDKDMRKVLQDVRILLGKIDKFIEDKTA